ncbi:MAG: PPC domain-containing protein [Anaerolineae bacterium]|nr:PPC domain-containing protein [Anaerolineae bacterium]
MTGTPTIHRPPATIRTLLVLLIGLAALIHPPVNGALAQGEPQRIAYGETVQGTFAPERAALYRFEAARGDQVRITLDAAPGSALDPLIVLLDGGQNAVLAIAHGDGGSTARLRFTVRRAGPYIIRVASAVAPEGAFTLALALENSRATPTPGIAVSDTLLTPGVPVTGSIDAEDMRQVYLVDGRAGQQLRIRLDAATGSALDPMLVLLDPGGAPLAENDDSAFGYVNARLDYTLLRSGRYVIVATRSDAGRADSAGDFTLRVDIAQAEAATATPEPTGRPDVTPIRYGSRVRGEIDDEAALVFYGFQGSPGDVIRVEMRAVGGSALQPRLYLYDYSGAPALVADSLAGESGGDAGQAVLNGVTLLSAGPYVIVATRRGALDGATVGAFEMALMGPSTVGE